MFGNKAKKENAQLKARIEELEAFISQHGLAELSAIQEAQRSELDALESFKRKAEAQRSAIEADIGGKERTVIRLKDDIKKLEMDLIEVRSETTLQNAGYYNYQHPAADSVILEGELMAVRNRIKLYIKEKSAVQTTPGFVFNNSASKGTQFVSQMSRMMLRAYNAEAENAIIKVKAGNLETAKARLTRTRTQIERLGKMIELRINNEFHRLRLRELELASQHLQAKAAAKEAEREERARLREEKRAQQEIERERQRLVKERTHYENVIKQLQEQNRTEEAAELQEKLKDIQRGIDDIEYRAANIRTGYVYVISNIGSFGENMVKIGMTRRLQPYDRVTELSDASVPFNFDVHAMHFSEDAVGIEAELHRIFADCRVNRVNNRREFFYTTPEAVKAELLKLTGNILEYIDEPDADQFYESQRLAKATNDR